MGLFNKKTAEERQAAQAAKYDAKFAKAEAALAREQKGVDRQRAAFDKATAEFKITLMKAGLDVREAEGITVRKTSLKESMRTMDYMVTMPDAVVIYTVANEFSTKVKDKMTPVKNTETIPYKSIHTVDFKDSLTTGLLTIRTSGKTYEFEAMGGGQFIVDTINERRG